MDKLKTIDEMLHQLPGETAAQRLRRLFIGAVLDPDALADSPFGCLDDPDDEGYTRLAVQRTCIRLGRVSRISHV